MQILPPESLWFSVQAQIFPFSKRRICEILRNAIISTFSNKNDIFGPKGLEKQQNSKINETLVYMLPPDSLKSLKTVSSDNHGNKYLAKCKIWAKSRLSPSTKNVRIFTGKPLGLKS